MCHMNATFTHILLQEKISDSYFVGSFNHAAVLFQSLMDVALIPRSKGRGKGGMRVEGGSNRYQTCGN